MEPIHGRCAGFKLTSKNKKNLTLTVVKKISPVCKKKKMLPPRDCSQNRMIARSGEDCLSNLLTLKPNDDNVKDNIVLC